MRRTMVASWIAMLIITLVVRTVSQGANEDTPYSPTQLSAAQSLGLWRQLSTLGHTPDVQDLHKVALTRVPSRFPKGEPLLISTKARVVETKDYTFIAELPLVWYAWDHLAGSEKSAVLDAQLLLTVVAIPMLHHKTINSLAARVVQQLSLRDLFENQIPQLRLPETLQPGSYNVEFIVEDTFPGLASDEALLSRRSVYFFKPSRQLADDRCCNVTTSGDKVARAPNAVALHSRSSCQDLPLFFQEPQYSSIIRIGTRVQVVLFVTLADLPTGVLIDEASMSLAVLESLHALANFFIVEGRWVRSATELKWQSVPFTLDSYSLYILRAVVEIPEAGSSNSTFQLANAEVCKGSAEKQVYVTDDVISIQSLSTQMSQTGLVELRVDYFCNILAAPQGLQTDASESEKNCVQPTVFLEIDGLTVDQNHLGPLCSKYVNITHQVRGFLTYLLSQGHEPQVHMGTVIRIHLLHMHLHKNTSADIGEGKTTVVAESSNGKKNGAIWWLSNNGQQLNYRVCNVSSLLELYPGLAPPNRLMTMLLATISDQDFRTFNPTGYAIDNYVTKIQHEWQTIKDNCFETALHVEDVGWPLLGRWIRLGLVVCRAVTDVCEAEFSIDVATGMAYITEDIPTRMMLENIDSLLHASDGPGSLPLAVSSSPEDLTILQTNTHETVVSQFMDNEHVDSEGHLSRVEHRPEERFSSVQCVGGIQHHMQTSFLGNTWDHNIAVCMVENVCWHDGALEYYHDTEEDLDPGFVNLHEMFQVGLVASLPIEARKRSQHGHGYELRYSPTLRTHPRRTAPYSEHDVHLLDFMGIGYNFGHFLIDHMLPALVALETFNLLDHVDRAQVVMFQGCNDFEDIFAHVTGSTPVPKIELCNKHYNDWLHKYFFKASVLLLNKMIGSDQVRLREPDVCFRKLILGHPKTFSQLSYRSPHFASHARLIRNRVLLNVASLKHLSRYNAPVHHVTVFLKGRGWHTKGEWEHSCSDTHTSIQHLGLEVRHLNYTCPRSDNQHVEPSARFLEHLNLAAKGRDAVHLRCHDPGTLPFEDQVSLSERTTTTVSFHGTVSYLILFQREKTSAIIVGRPPLKETDVMLHITSVRVVYMSIDKISEQYSSALYTSLNFAARAFNLQRVSSSRPRSKETST